MDQSNLTLYAYDQCSTCSKAKKWLKENNIKFKEMPVYDEPPRMDLFYHWVEDLEIPLQKFYNSSGLKYKELNMKERVKTMTLDEQVALLASHGKLVKRPLLTDGDEVLIGFKEESWATALLK